MTRREFSAGLRAIEKSNRLWAEKAQREVRMIYRAAVQKLLAEGTWNDAGIRRDIDAVYAAGVNRAAERADALFRRFCLDAVENKIGAVTPDPFIDGVYKTKDGGTARLANDTSDKPSGTWGTEEARLRAVAAIRYGRSVGMDIRQIAAMLDTMCERQGGKKAAMKIGRLFRVKDESGDIIKARWREGWERDWLEQSGFNVPYSKEPDSEFQKLFARHGGREWIDARAYGSGGRMKLPKVHGDFIKRLGSTGLSHVAARTIRTESQRTLNGTLEGIGAGPYASGKFEVELATRRDAWSCGCENIVATVRGEGGVTIERLKEIAAAATDPKGRPRGTQYDKPPFHDNCECYLMPVPLPAEEITRRAVAANR